MSHTHTENRNNSTPGNKKQETTRHTTNENRKQEESGLNKLRKQKQGLGVHRKRKNPSSPKVPTRKLKESQTTISPSLKGQRKINSLFIPSHSTTFESSTRMDQRMSPEKMTLGGTCSNTLVFIL